MMAPMAEWVVANAASPTAIAALHKSSIKSNKHITFARTTKNEDCEADKPPSLPAISQARGAGNGPGSDGLLDVAVMK
jgi:hypothetical protein